MHLIMFIAIMLRVRNLFKEKEKTTLKDETNFHALLDNPNMQVNI